MDGKMKNIPVKTTARVAHKWKKICKSVENKTNQIWDDLVRGITHIARTGLYEQ